MGAGVGLIPDRVSIHQRPDSVEGRKEFGHFEMDPIQNGKDFILTVTVRKTRFLLMERLANGKNAAGVAKAVIRLLKPFKKHVLSITTDNGGEFARHKLVSKALNAPVFFTDPYSSWQKGTIENTNKNFRIFAPEKLKESLKTIRNRLIASLLVKKNTAGLAF